MNLTDALMYLEAGNGRHIEILPRMSLIIDQPRKLFSFWHFEVELQSGAHIQVESEGNYASAKADLDEATQGMEVKRAVLTLLYE